MTWHIWHLYDISMTYWLHIASIHFSLELIRNIHSSGGAVQRGLIYPLEQLLGMAPSVAGDGVTGHSEIQRYYDLWYFVVIQVHGMRSPGLYNFASPGGEWSQLWPILFGARRFAGQLRAFPCPPRPLESVSRGLVTRRPRKLRRTLVRGCQGQAYTASATSPLSEQAFCPKRFQISCKFSCIFWKNVFALPFCIVLPYYPSRELNFINDSGISCVLSSSSSFLKQAALSKVSNVPVKLNLIVRTFAGGRQTEKS